MSNSFSRPKLGVTRDSFKGELAINELRLINERAQKGDSDIPVSAAKVVTDKPLTRLGAHGRFTTDTQDVVEASYCKFRSLDSSKPPVMYRSLADSEGPTVTNSAAASIDSTPIGVPLAAGSVGNSEYGWVLEKGLNPVDIALDGSGFTLGESIGPTATGIGKSDLTLGRVVNLDKIVEEGGVWVAKPGAIYFDVKAMALKSQQQKQIEAVAGSVAEVEDEVTRVTSRLEYRIGNSLLATIDSINQALGEDVRRVERAVFRNEQTTQQLSEAFYGIENQETLAAIANFSRLAESAKDSAERDAATVNTLAVAVNQSVETARVYQTEAGEFAESSREASNTALVSRNESMSFAQSSEAFSVTAGLHAASAESSATLAASVAPGFLHTNINFNNWPDPSSPPANWTLLGSSLSRVDSTGVSPYAARFTVTTSDAQALDVRRTTPDSSLANAKTGWYVVEADFILESGTLDGAGLAVIARDASFGFLQQALVPFATELGTATPPFDTIYRVARLVEITHASTDSIQFGAYGYWSALGAYAAKTIQFLRAGIRPATKPEIDTGTVLTSLDATVTDLRGAAADTSGKVAAFIKQVVAASGSNPAMMELLAGEEGSKIGLVADVISLGNSVDGIITEVVRVEGGQARLNNALIRGLRVAPRSNSEIFMDVALEPLIVTGGDGDTIEYEGGASFGAPPSRIEPMFEDLPALAEGERWKITIPTLGNTSFVPSVKKVSGGAISTTTVTGDSAGTAPQTRRLNKTGAGDAYNGIYTFELDIVASVTTATIEGITTYTYVAEGDIYTYNGTSWLKIGSYFRTWETYGAPGSATRTITVSGSDGRALGVQSPGFGAGATVGSLTQIASVTYSEQASPVETVVGDTIRWKVYAPPRT